MTTQIGKAKEQQAHLQSLTAKFQSRDLDGAVLHVYSLQGSGTGA